MRPFAPPSRIGMAGDAIKAPGARDCDLRAGCARERKEVARTGGPGEVRCDLWRLVGFVLYPSPGERRITCLIPVPIPRDQPEEGLPMSGIKMSGTTASLAVAFGVTAAALLTQAISAQAPARAGARQVTFNKDVAPILQRSCQNCHRPDSIAPMSFLTYEDVRPWARAIKTKTSAREMPPWFIDRTVGITQFKDDPSLSDRDIETIAAWADGGAVRGNPADLPAPRQFENADISHIGKPDLLVQSAKHTVPATGSDWWGDYVADTGLTEDRYLKAVETKPAMGAKKVTHHAVTFLMQDEGDTDLVGRGASGGGGSGGFLNE